MTELEDQMDLRLKALMNYRKKVSTSLENIKKEVENIKQNELQLQRYFI
jgi:uncharacterized protein YnzC (UPF0291/DUF896 family)